MASARAREEAVAVANRIEQERRRLEKTAEDISRKGPPFLDAWEAWVADRDNETRYRRVLATKEKLEKELREIILPEYTAPSSKRERKYRRMFEAEARTAAREGISGISNFMSLCINNIFKYWDLWIESRFQDYEVYYVLRFMRDEILDYIDSLTPIFVEEPERRNRPGTITQMFRAASAAAAAKNTTRKRGRNGNNNGRRNGRRNNNNDNDGNIPPGQW
jgi:hypothetical protein